MGKQEQAQPAPADGFVFYRITAKGRAAATAREPERLRCRYLADLLSLLATSGRSMKEHELRQFMPPASLVASIRTLLKLGLIECGEAPTAAPRVSAPSRYPALTIPGGLGA
jgi:hypothetical protein